MTTKDNVYHLVYVTGFWKTYHLHTNEIIRISDFVDGRFSQIQSHMIIHIIL